MYLGPLAGGAALEELVWWMVEAVVERYSAGRATWLWVTVAEGWVEIRDDGPGLAITSEAKSEREELHRRCTQYPGLHTEERTVHAYNLFRRGTCDLARVSGFSAEFELETRTHRGSYLLRTRRGVPLGPVRWIDPSLPTGTRIRFRPDPKIFGETKPDAARLRRRLRELAYLCPALTITFNGEEVRQRAGVRGWVEERVAGPVFSVAGRFGGVLVDLALGFALGAEERGGQLRSFVAWHEGKGAHVDGLFLGLWSAVMGEPCNPKAAKEEVTSLRRRLKPHVVAMIHVFPEAPAWMRDGRASASRSWRQTVTLVNPEVREAVALLVIAQLSEWLERVPSHAKRLRTIVGGAT